MNLKSPVIAVALLLCVTVAPATADDLFTTTADTTIDGLAGTILITEEPGFPTDTYFLCPQAGMIRVYATREAGSPTWDILTGLVHLVPKNQIDPGDTWRFLDDDQGNETIAAAIVEESVSTNAGVFTAWRVDVARVSNPTSPIQTVWFASGVGIVRQVEYFDQWIEWESNLDTYTANGNGYFPLVVGNVWSYTSGGVPVEATNMSSIKSRWGN